MSDFELEVVDGTITLDVEFTEPQTIDTVLTSALDVVGLIVAEGVQGPEGATGPQGIQGPAGPTGPEGPAGATEFLGTAWYYGIGPPGAIIGSKPNDWYFDLSSGDTYVLGG